MCIPIGKKRKKQETKAQQVTPKDPVVVQEECPYKQKTVPVEKPPRPKLVSLVVTGATSLGDDKHWSVADAVKTVQVRAVTTPDDASGWNELKWDGATSVSPDKRDATVRVDTVKNVVVKATLDDVEKSATIEIYDLVSVTCPLPNGKGYKSDKTTRLKAVTNPDDPKVWSLLTWSEGAPTAAKNECDADLKPVGERTVSVNLDTKKLDAKLKICQWPTLKIKEVTFECYDVLNDGAAEIGKKFDKKWIRGRKDPAVNQATSASQSPLCFTCGKKFKLSAKFEVVEKATEKESVKIEAALGFGKIEGTVDVGAGATEASLASTESSKELPSTVDAESSWNIVWKHLDYDGTTWLDADTSKHLRYLLLKNPKAPIYLTILDISCVAAKGKNSADDLVAESFKPFIAAKGTGKGFARKGDGVKMSYYNKGSSTATGDAVQTTKGMLGSADGTGRCGGWATLLRHMWSMHGVDAGRRWYIRATDQSLLNFDLRFLVKNCKFKATGTRPNSAYTHEGEIAKKEVEKDEGIPGHGQDNPQFDFGDHVVVTYGGKLYDPSYGVGPYDTDTLYLDAALCGLGKWPRIDFQFKTIDQHIPQECVPYGEGFAEYTIILNPLDFWAAGFKSTGAGMFADCDFFFPDSKTPITVPTVADVKPGYIVCFHAPWGDEWERMVNTVTLADIANKHGKTTDQVFDDPKNARIKSLRTKQADLKTGDTIVVSKALDPNCWLVVGHDL